MPDWSYQTVFRPLFMRMQAGTARDFALSSIGRLARFPFGRGILAVLGHMRPDDRLNVEAHDVHFRSQGSVKYLIPAYGGMITLWVGALLCREHLWGVPERYLQAELQ